MRSRWERPTETLKEDCERLFRRDRGVGVSPRPPLAVTVWACEDVVEGFEECRGVRRLKFSLGAGLPCFAAGACGILRASFRLDDNGVRIGASISISVKGSGWAKHRLAEEDSDSEEGVEGGRSYERSDPPPSAKALEKSDLGLRKVSGEGGWEFGVGGRSDNGGGVREGGIGRSRMLEVFLLKELLDVEVDNVPGEMSGGDIVPLPG